MSVKNQDQTHIMTNIPVAEQQRNSKLSSALSYSKNTQRPVVPTTLEALNEEFRGKANKVPIQQPDRKKTSPNELSRIYVNKNLKG